MSREGEGAFGVDQDAWANVSTTPSILNHQWCAMPILLARTCLLAALLACVGCEARAQGTTPAETEKIDVIRKILDVTHAADLALGAIEAAVPVQRASNPRIPAVFWDRFLVQARERRGEFVDSIIPLYSRRFELTDLKGLLQFYQSPLGQRLLETQPELMRESMQMGQRWGARLGAEIGQQLAAEGVQIQP